MEQFSRGQYTVLATPLGSHEAIVPGLREVLPAWRAILKSPYLAVVCYVAVT